VTSSRSQRLKSWIKRSRKREKTFDFAALSEQVPSESELTNPIENYYRHKARLSLPFFYRFALQTRSIEIRDVFAKISSDHGLNLTDLLAVIDSEASKQATETERKSLESTFDSETLLTLADLLANTARDDLDTHSAIRIYEFVLTIFDEQAFSDRNRLQYVEALNELERYDEATTMSGRFNINELAPFQQELLELHRVRRTAKTPFEWLEKLNAFYRQLGMSEIQVLDNESFPLLDRLTVAEPNRVEGPRISVIMPTFSPGPGIRTAIRSLLDQSWTNLEIIVVNDASPAEHRSIFDELEHLDNRITVVHQAQNAGAYVARNAGLKIATGDYITTHDDDDWSHPDKLATQVQVMLENEDIVASTSAHIRVSEEAVFRRVNMQAHFLQMNYSSLMFRKFVAEEIGPWDTVNRGGDSEFYTRLVEYYGEERVWSLHDRPLSFSRVWDGSLTSGEMSRGYFAYSRLLYRWAFRQWQWSSNKSGKKAIRVAGDERPYPIPTTFEAGQRHKKLGPFDVIYVTDFFRQAKHVDRALQEIETLSESGFRVGYMHLYSPETTVPAGIPPRLFDLQIEGRITQVGHDDEVETELLVLHDPSIGMFLDQLNSRIESKRSVVVDHMLPTLVGGEPRTPTIFAQALGNLDRFFNTRFEVAGGTADRHIQLQRLVPQSRLLPDDMVWHTHIGERPGTVTLPAGKPTVGFHSYGNKYRWPNNADTFRQIYSSETFSTRFYGQLDVAFQKFGDDSFRSMSFVRPEEQSEAKFLRTLDFWIYYPHYRLDDQVWEPILSAMQAGNVVILPPRLERLYGKAAVYAEPLEIATVVENFSNKPEKYVEQAERGQALVASKYSPAHLCKRINWLRGALDT